MRIRVSLGLLSVLAAACVRSDRPSAARADTLLRSGDRVAVYDAGVAAYRAKDYARARALWRRAAALGDHDAASNVGFLLYYGYGGPADSLAAGDFWRQAMAHGDAEAHRHVAQAILDGDERLGTLDEAYSHAVAARRLSQQPGDLGGEAVARDADQLTTALEARLSVAQREAAERLGEQWASEVRRK